MKLLCAEYNASGEVAYDVIGDNALLRNNDDFYIPVFAGELSCVPQVVFMMRSALVSDSMRMISGGDCRAWGCLLSWLMVLMGLPRYPC